VQPAQGFFRFSNGSALWIAEAEQLLGLARPSAGLECSRGRGVPRVIGDGQDSRDGSCAATDCATYFYDLSKNQSRRYCSLACQNRIKAAAYRSRQPG